MDITGTIISGLISAGVGFGSAGFSLKIGQTNFFKERMWEQRVTAYSKVLEALAKVKQYCYAYESYELGENRNKDESWQDHYKRTAGKFSGSYDEAKSDLTILALSESFILSPEATAHLKTLIRELNQSHEWETDLAAIDECIKAFNITAEADLRTKNWKR